VAKTALILFAHGARDPAWAAPFERLRAKMAAAHPTVDMRLAFLELMTPSLNTAVDDAVNAGAARIQVSPVFLAQGGHVKRDLPALIDAARLRHPNISFALGAPVGEAEAVLDAISAHISETLLLE
jgi:sirohydrochlorin cobaltochelatase